ncbi:hypothetical protein ASPACDRAFT_63784 [Aspergillus aculeatus ATCC 16872]|uniref:DUF1275 domain protein n=1 Tax=Aspergillus aculeatus (strain ATCC 16872 / CBS 172.66 / WB 5094) TaxID=690307 RepID=A0A1L9WJM3_ASPA1|nr:uncharacterized protein ASPACDRAFT_63784 [Aspergillus aculeatus ATCC 16872]OJJ96347.1 hypothetical protein ASPACDRAFT_63784 [Aspergillus aculeatus ATCC 16872]
MYTDAQHLPSAHPPPSPPPPCDQEPIALPIPSTHPFPTKKPSRRRQLTRYLNHSIHEDLTLEAQLLLLSFAIGIQDAAAWRDYGCFASNQTGNLLFLAIGGAGLADSGDYSFRHLGMSLGAFVAGGLVLGQLGNGLGAVRRRWWLLLSSMLQTGMVFAAAGMCRPHLQSKRFASREVGQKGEEEEATTLATLFLLAFSSGAQVAMGRALKITDITTAMATAAYVDVVIDPDLLRWRNRKRNRRVLFLGLLTAGCFVGAAVEKAAGSRVTLLVCAGCKGLVTLVFLFTPGSKKEG